MKTVSETLGEARSNVIERSAGARPRRGPQERPGDVELAGVIRKLVDARLTYGYRRIAALLKHAAAAPGHPTPAPVARISRNRQILLQRTGSRNHLEARRIRLPTYAVSLAALCLIRQTRRNVQREARVSLVLRLGTIAGFIAVGALAAIESANSAPENHCKPAPVRSEALDNPSKHA